MERRFVGPSGPLRLLLLKSFPRLFLLLLLFCDILSTTFPFFCHCWSFRPCLYSRHCQHTATSTTALFFFRCPFCFLWFSFFFCCCPPVGRTPTACSASLAEVSCASPQMALKQAMWAPKRTGSMERGGLTVILWMDEIRFAPFWNRGTSLFVVVTRGNRQSRVS